MKDTIMFKENNESVMQNNLLQQKAAKRRRLRRKECRRFNLNRTCRFEELENRELLSATTIDVGAVYVEQLNESAGDRFYIAWVGGESTTTLDTLIINLDKNLNNQIDSEEGYFDTTGEGMGVKGYCPFKVVEAATSPDITFSGLEVEDGGQVLKINLQNFHAGDVFCFVIDVDEYDIQPGSTNNSGLFEGSEMGGANVPNIKGSLITATFSSTHFESETWNGMYLEDYDDFTNQNSKRPSALANAFDDIIGSSSTKLPYDADDNSSGLLSAGVYGTIDLTPKPILISGYVYADLNVDCNFDRKLGDTDEPLANVEVTLTSVTTGDFWTTYTGDDGSYVFGYDLNLNPDDYTIQCQTNVVSPSGKTFYDFCAKGGNFGEKIDPLNIKITGLQGGDEASENNFSKVLPGSLDGYVFEDLNNKDNKEFGESGIPNVGVELWKLQQNEWVYVESVLTDANGYYCFKIDGSYSDNGVRKNVNSYYQIRELAVPDEYTDGKDYIGTLKGDVKEDMFDNIMVGYDQDGYNYNFGELKLGSISGNVFEDVNNNGNWERVSELPISNVKVELFQFDGEKYVSTGEIRYTDANGFYEFENLEIEYDYAVKEYQETAKYIENNVEKIYDDGKMHLGSKGGDDSVRNYFSAIHIGWADYGTDYDFGELKLGYIEGNVYEDRNDNGIYERAQGEVGIEEPLKIGLYKWNGTDYEFIRETVTDSNGFYYFDKLDINEQYAVQEIDQPADYSDGKDTAGTINGKTVGTTEENEWIKEITIGWADRGIEYNFGKLKLGSIAGNVYEDLNDNGIFERDTENGISAVTVILYQWTDIDGSEGHWTEINRQQTKDDGSYLFTDLSIEQKYAIREVQPTDYTDGKDTVGTINGYPVGTVEDDYIKDVGIKWDNHGIEYNFGELKLGSIAGNVYEDLNNNGIFERETEKGISAVTVILYQWTAINGSEGHWTEINRQQTKDDGSYLFTDLSIEQKYAIREVQPTDYTDGKDTVGTINGYPVGTVEDDYIKDVGIKWDNHGIEYNFGELKLGAIAGNVYNDLNNNGIFERATEKGISAVTVILYQWTAIDGSEGHWTEINRQQTKSDGSYLFTELDINERYAIREIQPEGWNDGKDTVGTINGKTVGICVEDDFLQDIDIKWDNHGIEYNFGELKPLSPGQLSGYVYIDANKNGIMDSGELGIVNTTLTLWKLNTESGQYELMNRTTLTDSAGYYYFDNLEPQQTYRITETQPVGYENGQDSIGTLGGKVADDDLYDIYVDSGDNGVYYNFGEYIITTDPPTSKREYYGYTRTSEIRLPNTNNYGAPGYSFNYIQNNPIDMQHTISYYGGGGLPVSYSWHLSVLNGGYPRSVEALTSTAGYRAFLSGGTSYMNVAYSQESLSYGEWMIRNRDGSVERQYVFGMAGSRPVVGDWNGDGKDSIGVYVNGHWFLDRNGDGKWDEDDLYAELGAQTDQAVTGDWDGDGKSDIGIFGPQWSGDLLAVSIEPGLPTDLNQYITVSRPKNIPPEYNKTSVGHRTLVHRNNGQMRLDLIDHVFEYGTEGDVAVAGDWNGDGISKIGVYRHGTWFLDVNGNGEWDEGDVMVEHFSAEEGIPVVGDFNGDGIDDIAVFAHGQWDIDTTGDYKPNTHFTFGQDGDLPYAGDFNGDGVSEVGIYRPASDADVAVKNK